MLVIILEETGSLLYISPGHEDLDGAEKKWPATMEAIDGGQLEKVAQDWDDWRALVPGL